MGEETIGNGREKAGEPGRGLDTDARITFASVALALFLIACALMAVKSALTGAEFNFATGDARWYVLYASSAVVDRDLDFENEMREGWGAALEPADLTRRTPRGMVWNKYPIGLSLTLLPGTATAHLIASAADRVLPSTSLTPNGRSPVYQIASLATVIACVWGTMLLLYRLLVAELAVRHRTAMLAVLAVSLGSPYFYYAVRLPLTVHVVSTFWVVAAVWLSVAAAREAERGRIYGTRWASLAFASSMAVICRPSNLLLALFLIHPVAAVLRHGGLPKLARAFAWALPGLLPLAAQALVWRAMFGSFLVFSYGEEGFNWLDPALLASLFSIKRGLFVWAPMLGAGVLGLAWALARRPAVRRHPLLLASVAATLILWYVNSAWWCWWFGWSFGNRGFLEMTLLFTIGLALGLEEAHSLGRSAWRSSLAVVGGCALFNLALIAVYDLQLLPELITR